jgi:hypothetical protein
MSDLSDIPLTEMEKRVFGVDAKRRPDGSIIERGIGSAETLPVRAPSEEPRTIDLRAVHSFPERMQ